MTRLSVKHVLLRILAVALAAAGAIGLFKDDLEELDAARAQRTTLLEEYRRLAGLAVNLDLYKQQLRELDESFGDLLKRLPNLGVYGDRERDIRETIRAAAAKWGIGLPVVSVGAEHLSEFYAYRRLDVMTSGGFRGLVAFTQQVSTGSTENWTIQYASLKPRGAGRDLTLLLELRVYRFRSDDEIAAARKAAQKEKR